MSRCSLLLLTACSGDAGHDTACTELAAYAVWLTLTDADSGTPLLDGTATYARDGGDPLACDPLGGGDLICGWEVSGTLTLSATAPGHATASQAVEVTRGPCHVRSQSTVLTLSPDVARR